MENIPNKKKQPKKANKKPETEKNLNKKHKIIIAIICSLITIILVSFIYVVYRKYSTPTIFLNGRENLTINLSDEYIELGANSFINDNKKNISNKIKISGHVDTEKPGTYKIYYTVENHNIERTVTRTVTVVDDVAPVMALNGKEKIEIYQNAKYNDEGATATDNIDGDISSKILVEGSVDTSKVGTYTISYSVTDKAGNNSKIERKVEVKEKSTAYIKISIDAQKIWLYKNDALVLESNIVTGNMGTNDTPRGKFKIYSKARNTYLKGADYVSYVNYWMAIHGGIGLHDASWRSEFGGDIYTTNGSHGCINLPSNVAATIYEIANVGTIVEVY